MILNECYSVPQSIINHMTNLDPLLRLHWDQERSQVRVERKVTRGQPLNPELVSRKADYEMARDGYAPWLAFTPSEDNYAKLLHTIKVMDLWKRGGAEAVADQLERDEAREAEEKKVSRKSDFHEIGAEMYRDLNTPRTGWNPYEVKAD